MKYLLIGLMLLTKSAESQKWNEVVIKVETKIQKVSLLDTFLIRQIKSFISEIKFSDSDFIKYGYIKLSIERRPYKSENIFRSYYINKDYFGFDNTENDNLFSPYYSIIDNKIIIIRFPEINAKISYHFTDTVKRAFQQMIDPYLFPKSDRRRMGMWRGGGKYIWIFNSDRPPLILGSKEAGFYD